MDAGNFKQWLGSREVDESPVDMRLIELHEQMTRYWEAGGEPITLPRGQMDFPLQYAGRHLDKVLPNAEPGKPRIIRGPDQNYLIPLDSLEQITGDGNAPKNLSHFVRDMPYIGAFSQASAENMASAIIFVQMTIRADFMQVMHSFPVVMSLLMSKFGTTPVSADELESSLNDMEGRLAAASKPSARRKTDQGHVYRVGYGNRGQIFSFKYEGIATVWNKREEMYSRLMDLVQKKDTVAVFKYLLANVKGLAQAKAGFCVQLIFGELGCIDMHNVNLYSQFYLDRGQAKSRTQVFQPNHMRGDQTVRMPGKRDVEMYNQLHPKAFGPSYKPPGIFPSDGTDRQKEFWQNRDVRFVGAVKSYIDTLKKLEDDGFNTIKLWDIWVSYVANAYVKKDGDSRYARDGMLAGNPLDPENDATDRKIMQTRGPIPDRNAILTANKDSIDWRQDPETGHWHPHTTKKKGERLPTYSVDGMDKEKSAGAASLSHGAIHWWRNPDYWWDLVNQARGERPKDGVRYASDDWAGMVSDVPRVLPYIDQNPELLNSLFPDASERKEFKQAVKDVLDRHDFYGVTNPLKPTRASKHKSRKKRKSEDQSSLPGIDWGD